MSGLTIEPGSQVDVVEVYSTETLVLSDGDIEIISEGQQGPGGPAGTTNPKQFTVPYAASITIDWASGDIGVLTLTGNAVISMTGTRKKAMLIVTQGGVGNYTITYDSTVSYGTDITSVILSTTVGKSDYLGYALNGITGKYNVIAFARGY